MLGGIASGVALIAALGIINESVVANFRTMLERAADLSLRHPRTGSPLSWHSRPPADFQAAWSALGGSTIP